MNHRSDTNLMTSQVHSGIYLRKNSKTLYNTPSKYD